jgi:hypothetical protein
LDPSIRRTKRRPSGNSTRTRRKPGGNKQRRTEIRIMITDINNRDSRLRGKELRRPGRSIIIRFRM